MKRIFALALGLSMIMPPAQIFAQDSAHSTHTSHYAGLETRAIKSLSQDDIDELQRGGGWGLALAAELNGVPGPAHLLELKEQIGLSGSQVTAIEEIFAEMQGEAIALGEQLIAAEAAIEEAFVAQEMDDEGLRMLIEHAGKVRADLRFVHLSRHLSTPPLLSLAQIDAYKTLRGYGTDPCTNVPEGHDAAAWLQHNGCT